MRLIPIQVTVHATTCSQTITMPQCQVHDCRLRRGHGEGKKVSFFSIPNGSKPELREIAQKWLHYCGTGYTVQDFSFGYEKVVCERHFTPDSFTDDSHIRMCQMLGETPKWSKRLKAGAVPTVVSHHRQTYDPDREARAKQRSHKKVELNRGNLSLSHTVMMVRFKSVTSSGYIYL